MLSVLKNLDPLLTADLLYALATMGHGDEIAVVDANFPAYTLANVVRRREIISLAGTGLPEAIRAVLSVLPVDDSSDTPVRFMASSNSPDKDLEEIHRDLRSVVRDATAGSVEISPLERFAFYEAVRECYAIVQTGERRYFGNVLVKKGAIPPPAS
jgi:L-fucose mutarotase